MRGPDFGGWPVVVSPALPLRPSPGEQGRRIVRHGMADVLAWLGEDVGPKPEALTHVMFAMDPARSGGAVAFVSAEMYERLTRQGTAA